jgi:hypothetical protein
MILHGLSTPPQIIIGETIRNATYTAAATAWPTMADGTPWEYIMITTGGSGAFSAGGSTVDAATAPWAWVAAINGPVILNVAGTTHYSLAPSAGGTVLITPIARGGRGGNVLPAPPQIVASTLATSVGGVSDEVAIPKYGNHPTKYILLSQDAATYGRYAVGPAGLDPVSGGGDEQMFLGRDSGPVLLNVAGMTHVAWRHAGVVNMSISALGF